MKNILFDLDGTLSDSGPGIIHCVQSSLAALGLPVPDEKALRVCVGPPLRDSYLRFGVKPEDVEKAVELYRKDYVVTGQYENVPYPGIEEVLKELKARGHKLYVATSKPEAMSIEILTRFGFAPYFDRICGATPGTQRNTKEEVIAYLLSQIDSRDELVMVGDTIYDVQGAKSHDIPCLAVTWGYGDTRQMAAAGATLVDSMQGLLDAIEG